MPLEGASAPPEKQEHEPLTDEQAQEFYVAGNTEKFHEWVNQQQARIEAFQGNRSYAQMFFEQKLARIQLNAGEVSDAIERFKDLAYRAWQEGDELAKQSFADETQERERVVRLQQMRDFEAACDFVLRGEKK